MCPLRRWFCRQARCTGRQLLGYTLHDNEHIDQNSPGLSLRDPKHCKNSFKRSKRSTLLVHYNLCTSTRSDSDGTINRLRMMVQLNGPSRRVQQLKFKVERKRQQIGRSRRILPALIILSRSEMLTTKYNEFTTKIPKWRAHLKQLLDVVGRLCRGFHVEHAIALSIHFGFL